MVMQHGLFKDTLHFFNIGIRSFTIFGIGTNVLMDF